MLSSLNRLRGILLSLIHPNSNLEQIFLEVTDMTPQMAESQYERSSWRQLYKNRTSRKINSQRIFLRE